MINIDFYRKVKLCRELFAMGDFEEAMKFFEELKPGLVSVLGEEKIERCDREVFYMNYGVAVELLDDIISSLWNFEETMNCNSRWEYLHETDNLKIRFCSRCAKNVYLIDEDVHEIGLRLSLDQNIAVKIKNIVIDYDQLKSRSCVIKDFGPKFDDLPHDQEGLNLVNKQMRKDEK